MQKGSRGAVFHRQQAKHGCSAEDDKRQNSDHLDQREPEFALREEASGDYVEQENGRAENQTPQPNRRLWEPILHAETGGGQAGTECDGPGEPIEPGHGITGRRTKIAGGINMEGAGFRHRHRKLAQAQHDQIDHQCANQIGQQGTQGAGGGNDIAGVEKQPGTDHATQRQHHQVPGLHGAFELPFGGDR
ncbi:hypothetical protein D3C72_1735510 [compost metagenome]